MAESLSIIVDARHHLSRYSRAEYPWIGDEMDALHRDPLPHDLWRELDRVQADGRVAVQARPSLAEIMWLLDHAWTDCSILGVVGWVPSKQPDLEEVVDELSAYPLLKGDRHVVQDEVGWLPAAAGCVIRGIAMLNCFDLSYDLLIPAGQLREAGKPAQQLQLSVLCGTAAQVYQLLPILVPQPLARAVPVSINLISQQE